MRTTLSAISIYDILYAIYGLIRLYTISKKCRKIFQYN